MGSVCPNGSTLDGGVCYYCDGVIENGKCISACPAGYQDQGGTCKKPYPYEYYRGDGDECEAKCNMIFGEQCDKVGDLWYPPCRQGYAGSESKCLLKCPNGSVNSTDYCEKYIVDQPQPPVAAGLSTELILIVVFLVIIALLTVIAYFTRTSEDPLEQVYGIPGKTDNVAILSPQAHTYVLV